MGTRNLTIIIKDNEIKLSQYGQWDGYFSYTGKKFIEFVKNNLQGKTKKQQKWKIEEFVKKVNKLKPITKEYFNKLIDISDNLKDKEGYTIPFNQLFPQLSRDTGVKILNIINELKTYDFKNESKFPVFIDIDCDWIEYIYVINLDTQEIYMLTTNEFNGEIYSTCKLVEETFKLDCWYKSNIFDLPSVKNIENFTKKLELK